MAIKKNEPDDNYVYLYFHYYVHGISIENTVKQQQQQQHDDDDIIFNKKNVSRNRKKIFYLKYCMRFSDNSQKNIFQVKKSQKFV
jgi:hypothetical protein